MSRNFKKEEISIHTAVDNSDPGFTLRGHVLRWQSGHVASRKAGRIWDVLKISQIPKDALDVLKTRQYRWFSKDGDTIRRGDLVLSYAPKELVDRRRQELRSNQDANEAVLRTKTTHENEVETTGVMTREVITAAEQSAAENYK